jgi:hypothetical protein
MTAMAWAQRALQHASVSLRATVLNPRRPEFAVAFAPLAAYWALCFVYDCLDRVQHPAVARFRIARVRPDKRGNQISKRHVCQRVLVQHALQVFVACVMFIVDPHQCDAFQPAGWARTVSQVLFGMLVMDTWQVRRHMGGRAGGARMGAGRRGCVASGLAGCRPLGGASARGAWGTSPSRAGPLGPFAFFPTTVPTSRAPLLARSSGSTARCTSTPGFTRTSTPPTTS